MLLPKCRCDTVASLMKSSAQLEPHCRLVLNCLG
jgi:hypothetical protein